VITFRSIEWTNFLSTGNTPTKILLDKSPTTLIVGHNGAGKSTLLDAVSFGLFGRPHREINKPSLVNSINKKNCMVTIEFDIGDHNFIINRGIKPAVFEIWQNDHMINQSSNTRDYQKYLEQNILKLNHKSFHQIVVLGSSSFIPFMQLKAAARREVIEDLLDINIFTKMNGLLREEVAKLKETNKDIGYSINLSKSRKDLQQKHIDDMNKASEGIKATKRLSMMRYDEEKAALISKSASMNAQYDEYDKITDKSLVLASDTKSALSMDLNTSHVSLKALMKESKFYSNNTECPSCTQTIDETLRKTKIADITSIAKIKIGVKSTLEDKYREALTAVDDITELLKKKRDLSLDIRMNDTNINNVNANILALNEEIQNSTTSSADILATQAELNITLEEYNSLVERRSNIVDDLTYHIACTEMFKDTGIKTKIIKEYLPAMNKLINQYLQTLDFFVSFNLDENFNEYIRSRHRDDFQYASFSEGEKQRIDLALLFTWRHVAKMKNSVSTNLLILDETFDSSMDQDGVDNLMKILNMLDADILIKVLVQVKRYKEV